MWWLAVLPGVVSAERYYAVPAPTLSQRASPHVAWNLAALGTPTVLVPAVPNGPSQSESGDMWMPAFVALGVACGLALGHHGAQPAGRHQPPATDRLASTSHFAQRLPRAGTVTMMAKMKKKDIQVVLKSGVKGLGKAGEVVWVKPAYAENVLLKQGLAAAATADVLKDIEKEVAAKEAAATAAKQEAKQKGETLTRAFGDMGCFIEKNVGPDGLIFGSVTPSELAELIEAKAGVAVDKKAISIPAIKTDDAGTIPPQKPGGASIKIAGTAIADITLHPDVVCKLKIVVVPISISKK